MTLPTSGSLSLAQIRGEFGAPAGTPLHAFVRGGAWVPNITANNGVPTAPPVSIDDLRGATAYQPVSVTATNASGTAFTNGQPFTASAGNSQATATGGSGTISYSWTHISGYTFGTSGTNTANCSFTHTVPPSGSITYSGVYRVTASDGTTSDTDDITVTLTVQSM